LGQGNLPLTLYENLSPEILTEALNFLPVYHKSDFPAEYGKLEGKFGLMV